MSPITDLFSSPLSVINVGAAMFADDVEEQGTPVTHLQWSPPGGGSPEVVQALTKMAQPDIAERIEAAIRQVKDAR